MLKSVQACPARESNAWAGGMSRLSTSARSTRPVASRTFWMASRALLVMMVSFVEFSSVFPTGLSSTTLASCEENWSWADRFMTPTSLVRSSRPDSASTMEYWMCTFVCLGKQEVNVATASVVASVMVFLPTGRRKRKAWKCVGVDHLPPVIYCRPLAAFHYVTAASQGRDMTGHAGLPDVSVLDLLHPPQPSYYVLRSVEGRLHIGEYKAARGMRQDFFRPVRSRKE